MASLFYRKSRSNAINDSIAIPSVLHSQSLSYALAQAFLTAHAAQALPLGVATFVVMIDDVLS